MDYASSISPNPSSIHFLGVEAKKELESSRTRVAEVLNARPSEIIFTSGGTESNNLAIQGVIWAWHENNKKIKTLPHIITTNIEHPSVFETCKMLEKRKLAEISIVEVEKNGIVDVKKIKKEIKNNTVLISVMYANNEIGTIQPIKEIAKEIRHYNKKNRRKKVFEWSGRDRDPENRGPEKTLLFPVFFHTDAVQAVNYLDINIARLGVDLLSISGSKIEGAGKVGILFKKNLIPMVSIFGGGNQEGGLRPGTPNLSESIKFSQALKFAEKIKEKEVKRLFGLQNYFLKKLNSRKINFILNGSLENRLPNNINITILKIPSDLLVIELSAKGIMVSSKSACKEGDGKASYVIEAINKNIKSASTQGGDTDGSLRFSFGRQTDKKDINYVIASLEQILNKLKKWYY